MERIASFLRLLLIPYFHVKPHGRALYSLRFEDFSRKVTKDLVNDLKKRFCEQRIYVVDEEDLVISAETFGL